VVDVEVGYDVGVVVEDEVVVGVEVEYEVGVEVDVKDNVSLTAGRTIWKRYY